MNKKKSKKSRHTNAAATKRAPRIPLSLRPLSFDEAVSDILKVKPQPKEKPRTPKKRLR
jgi:hypothetical protein